MTTRARAVFPALVLAAVVGLAALPGVSQTMAPGQGMMSAPMPGGMPPGGMPTMMGVDQDSMMPMMMMRGMMARRASLMFEHVEGRIAFLKTELKITDAQMPQWNRFADVLRSTAASMNSMHQGMMQSPPPGTLPDRLNLRETMLSSHLEALKSFRAAVEPLYASFSDEQKKTADELMLRPMMGMM
jgi:hypothetical protein